MTWQHHAQQICVLPQNGSVRMKTKKTRHGLIELLAGWTSKLMHKNCAQPHESMASPFNDCAPP